MPTDYEAAIAAIDDERLLELERRLSNLEPRVTRLETGPFRLSLGQRFWLKVKSWFVVSLLIGLGSSGCARIGEHNQAIISSPTCYNNYSSLHLWSNEGSQICFSGNGFINLRNYCEQGFWPFNCNQTWDKQVNSYETNDEQGYFVAAYFDPNTGSPIGSQYQWFDSGTYQPWAEQITRDAYGIQITYSPVIQ